MNASAKRSFARQAGSAVQRFFGEPRRAAASVDAGNGFFESSFDLRTGLEVSEAPLAELPEEFKREFASRSGPKGV